MPKIPLSPFLVPANDPGPEPGAPSRTGPRHEHLPPPRQADVMQLGPAALFVVATLRAWVAPRMRPEAEHPDWRALFGLAGVAAPGLVGFDVMMTVIGAQARRLIDVHCCACRVLGEDERAMLHLVAALQAGLGADAARLLLDWLPAEAVGRALDGAGRFAAGMEAAGLLLAPARATLH
jgi:hypothetical protein